MLSHKTLLTILLLTSFLLLCHQQRQLIAYYESSSDPTFSQSSDLGLSKLPPYINSIIISFFQPDNQYTSGSLTFHNTGLQFSSDPNIIKEAIATAKSNGTQVLLGIGGTTYNNWADLNEAGIAAFVKDFGLDGVDIYYRTSCRAANGATQCFSNEEYLRTVDRIRNTIPPPSIVSLTVPGTGAFGEGDFANDGPEGETKGSATELLNSNVGKSLDQVNVMASEADDPTRAFQAYKSLFEGNVTLGVEIPFRDSGLKVSKLSDINRFGDFVSGNGNEWDGIMIYTLNKVPAGEVWENNPSTTMICQEICRKFELLSCNLPLNVSSSVELAKQEISSEVIKPPRGRKRKFL